MISEGLQNQLFVTIVRFTPLKVSEVIPNKVGVEGSGCSSLNVS